MDSGSAECVAPESIAKNIPETEASRQGQTYHTADGGVIKNKGEKTVTMYSETGDTWINESLTGKRVRWLDESFPWLEC